MIKKIFSIILAISLVTTVCFAWFELQNIATAKFGGFTADKEEQSIGISLDANSYSAGVIKTDGKKLIPMTTENGKDFAYMDGENALEGRAKYNLSLKNISAEPYTDVKVSFTSEGGELAKALRISLAYDDKLLVLDGTEQSMGLALGAGKTKDIVCKIWLEGTSEACINENVTKEAMAVEIKFKAEK